MFVRKVAKLGVSFPCVSVRCSILWYRTVVLESIEYWTVISGYFLQSIGLSDTFHKILKSTATGNWYEVTHIVSTFWKVSNNINVIRYFSEFNQYEMVFFSRIYTV